VADTNMKPKGVINTPKLGTVKLYSKIVAGASGAVSSQTAENSSGFVFSKPAGTGIYRLTFTANWPAMQFIQGMVYNAGTAKGNTIELKVKLGAVTAKVADIHVVSDAGAAEDLTSGDELWLEVTMANTTVGP
jgi:hypothetical protein